MIDAPGAELAVTTSITASGAYTRLALRHLFTTGRCSLSRSPARPSLSP